VISEGSADVGVLGGTAFIHNCRADDGEGTLLAQIRRIAPRVPLGVAPDLHGNVTEAMIDHSDVIVGFKTSIGGHHHPNQLPLFQDAFTARLPANTRLDRF
jgi:hypothetical protein